MIPLNRRGRSLSVLAAIAAAMGLALPFHLQSRSDGLTVATALVRAAGAETLTLTAPVTLLDEPRIVLEKGTISLAAERAPAGPDALDALLSSGRARFALEDATISIGAGPQASSAIDLAPLLAALVGTQFESVAIRRASVECRNCDDVAVLIGSLTANVQKMGAGLSAKGKLERAGESLTFEASAMAGRNPKSAWPVTVRVSGPLLETQFRGRILRSGQLRLVAPKSSLKVPDLQRLAKWLGLGEIDVPGLRAFTAQGQLEADGTGVSFQAAQFTIDGSAMSGGLSFGLDAGKPTVEGTVAFGTLDIAPYLSRTGAKFAYASSWLAPRAGPGEPLASIIPYLDADLRISAARVVRAGERLGRGAASLVVKGGRLHASITEMELENGGAGQGQFTIDMRDSRPRYSMGGQIETAGIDRTWFGALSPAPLEGKVAVSGHAAASGSSVAELLASLEGRLTLTTQSGATVGIDVEQLFAPAIPDKPGWGTALSATTRVDALDVTLNAASGVLITQSATLASAGKTYTAAGTIDPARHTIDLSVTRTAPVTTTIPLDSRASTTMQIKGALAAPSITPAQARDRAAAPDQLPEPPG